MKKFFILLFLIWPVMASVAQSQVAITVRDSVTHESLPGATAYIVSMKRGAAADLSGVIRLANIPDGKQEIRVSFMGYNDRILSLMFPVATDSLVVLLSPASNQLDEVTISVTRTNSRLDNSSMKIEVIGRDDMLEENTIKPGNVMSILGDVSGIQIQQLSATSGSSNVRIQGLDGKYTQILRDGLPLFDGFSGDFGILQVAPLDLQQIEIVKGSASTLYGGGAISGIINFVSKSPSEKPEAVLTLNQTTLTESNINGFFSQRNNRSGYTLFSGFTRQNAVDVNKDGFSDVPSLTSMNIHPRYFWYFGNKATLNAGITINSEKREGGDMNVLKHLTDSIHQYSELISSQRITGDIGFSAENKRKQVLNIKGCASYYNMVTENNSYWFGASQLNSFGEMTWFIPWRKNEILAGGNFSGSMFDPVKADSVLFGKQIKNTMGLFVQNTFKSREKLFVEAGLRSDFSNNYGVFMLPRLSVLYKLNKHFFTRIGCGMGYKTPDLNEAGITEMNPRLFLPLDNGLKAETSTGGSFELNYSALLFQNVSVELNNTFFYTQIASPLVVATDSSGNFCLKNLSNKATTRGNDTYLRISMSPWEFYFGYTFTLAGYNDGGVFTEMTYTPKHRVASTLVFEPSDNWRFGLEGSWNSSQLKEDGSMSRSYTFIAAMIERKIRNTSIVLNVENLLDFRQTRFEDIVVAPFAHPAFKTLWAPIDGRVLNLSVVVHF